MAVTSRSYVQRTSIVNKDGHGSNDHTLRFHNSCSFTAHIIVQSCRGAASSLSSLPLASFLPSSPSLRSLSHVLMPAAPWVCLPCLWVRLWFPVRMWRRPSFLRSILSPPSSIALIPTNRSATASVRLRWRSANGLKALNFVSHTTTARSRTFPIRRRRLLSPSHRHATTLSSFSSKSCRTRVRVIGCRRTHWAYTIRHVRSTHLARSNSTLLISSPFSSQRTVHWSRSPSCRPSTRRTPSSTRPLSMRPSMSLRLHFRSQSPSAAGPPVRSFASHVITDRSRIIQHSRRRWVSHAQRATVISSFSSKSFKIIAQETGYNHTHYRYMKEHTTSMTTGGRHRHRHRHHHHHHHHHRR